MTEHWRINETNGTMRILNTYARIPHGFQVVAMWDSKISMWSDRHTQRIDICWNGHREAKNTAENEKKWKHIQKIVHLFT